jgi:hypothetical protein
MALAVPDREPEPHNGRQGATTLPIGNTVVTHGEEGLDGVRKGPAAILSQAQAMGKDRDVTAPHPLDIARRPGRLCAAARSRQRSPGCALRLSQCCVREFRDRAALCSD